MIEELLKNKPKSIHELIPSEFFTKYDSYDYVWSGNCFEWYWALGKTIQPKTFMEIGVRFGFSFLPTIQSSANLEYALGWDLETYGDNFNDMATENIQKYYYGDAKWEIKHVNSQIQTELPGFFDLISIDGCHDYDCKVHDLKLCINKCNYVILDDYDYHADVKNSTDFFLGTNSEHIEWSEYLPTYRGSMLIKFKNDNN